MGRRDHEDLEDLLAQSRDTIATLQRLTTRLEAFTDQLVNDLQRQKGADHGEPAGPE